jgi:predicted MFS family arabinose efflux permease
MSAVIEHHALPPRRELATLVMLGAVQFTHVLDFMIMMPLGAQLMRVFHISPSQFSHLVAAYGLSAAVSGFTGGFFLDRFDRKRSLLVLYAAFTLATVACGLAPNHHALLLARIAAGAFGGLAGSVVGAMIGDIVPPGRRGRASSIVMSAFPVASVLGVPAGLLLAGHYGWHAPFFLLAGCSLSVWIAAAFILPHLKTAIHDHEPIRQMREILSHGLHLRAFALGITLVMAGGVLIAFLAPSYVANVGLDEATQLPWAYAAGGIATAISTPLIGRLSDRMDRLHLLAWMSALAAGAALFITRLGPSPLPLACAMMAIFMVTMSGRFSPAMAMITNAVSARYRGGFMSVNAALQQAASAAANILAGWFITRDAAGHLLGFPNLGYVAVILFAFTVFLAARLRAAAPHVARPATA